jgi:hypothetical protein
MEGSWTIAAQHRPCRSVGPGNCSQQQSLRMPAAPRSAVLPFWLAGWLPTLLHCCAQSAAAQHRQHPKQHLLLPFKVCTARY